MQQILDADAHDRFVIHVNDHRGLAAAESDLARRSHESNSANGGDTDLIALLADIIDQNEDDRHRLDELLSASGGRANPVKPLVARAGEWFGRFKPNGQLRGYSPLSRVIEIEALMASAAIRRGMWIGVEATSHHAIAADARWRAEQAADHQRRLEQQLVPAARDAFDVME